MNKLKMNEIPGKTFVVTGHINQQRSEVKKFIKNAGGIVKNCVDRETDYLISLDSKPTGKRKKAVIIGIPVIFYTAI